MERLKYWSAKQQKIFSIHNVCKVGYAVPESWSDDSDGVQHAVIESYTSNEVIGCVEHWLEQQVQLGIF